MEDPEILSLDEAVNHLCPDGVCRPRVTGILKDLGFTDFSSVPADVLLRACDRGTQVHYWVQWLETDLRYYDEIPSDILPFCDAYLEMKEATGWQPRLLEHLVFDEHWNYSGVLDGLGSMRKKGIEEILADYKSGVPQPAARWQTAAYACAASLSKEVKPLVPRVAIYLKSSGKYSFDWYDKPEHRKDFLRWRSIVETYHLKNGGIK